MQREHFPLNDVLVGLHTGLTDTEIEETENPSLAERLPVDRKGMGMDPLLLLRLEILPEFCLTNAVLGRLAIIRGCFHLLLCPKSPTWFTIGDPLMLVHTNSSQVSMGLLTIQLHHPFPCFQILTCIFLGTFSPGCLLYQILCLPVRGILSHSWMPHSNLLWFSTSFL